MKLLNAGANPNCARQKDAYYKSMYIKLYTLDEHPILQYDIDQPTTPLKLVVFRISDCMLKDIDLVQFKKIAKLLINAGANVDEAILYIHHRYGTECTNSVIETIKKHNRPETQ